MHSMALVKPKSINKVGRRQICDLINVIANNPEEYIKIYPVRRFDSYDGIWIEEVGINQKIIMAPSDVLFDKLKSVVLIEERVKYINKAKLKVYLVKVPYINVEFNAIMYDNDKDHNDYAKAFIRWQVIIEVLSYFRLNFWSELDSYLDSLCRELVNNGMTEDEALEETYKEAYNRLRELGRMHCA